MQVREEQSILIILLSSYMLIRVQAQQSTNLEDTSVPSSKDKCFGQTVTLACTHPDPSQDSVKYLLRVVGFIENGEVLDFGDLATARRFTRTVLSNTASTLSFTVTEEYHANRVINCSCFLTLNGGGREESDPPITINVNETIQPPTIVSKPNSTSGLLQWNLPSSNCSNYQYIFTLTWVRIGDGSTGTVSTEENRYDFTGMPGGEYTVSLKARVTNFNLIESKPVNDCWITIIQPPTLVSKPTSTSGLLQWNLPSSSCSNYQYIFTLTWVRIVDGSTGTVSTAENRYDFTGMPGGEYTVSLKTRVTNFNLSESQPVGVVFCWLVSPQNVPVTAAEGIVSLTALAAVSAVAGLFLIISMVLAVILVGILVRMRRRRREEGQERKRRDPGEANVPPVPMTTNPSYAHVQHSTEKKIPLYGNL